VEVSASYTGEVEGMEHKRLSRSLAFTCTLVSAFVQLHAASDEELAKKLANPVAALISVPLQLNYDRKIGPAEKGERWSLNIQPVIPFDLGGGWNVISRTIAPIVSQDNIYPGAGSQFGLGDILQSLFFSPKSPTSSGWIWGAGPVLLLPTGTDDLLTGKKWGAGPTAVAVKQIAQLTYGLLFNHIWSYAGDSRRSDVSTTFLQPFFSYTTATAWSFTLQTETTYDWENEQWSVPINASASKVLRIGTQTLSVGGGVRYWADGPQLGPHGWGARASVTFMFPK